MITITLIGCGKLGKTLGHLFSQQHNYQIQDILCRSLKNGKIAREFINAGRVVDNYRDLTTADVFLLAVPDDELSVVIQHLLETNIVKQKNIVFHCSGALSSSLLIPFKSKGAYVASIHPITSLGNPSQNIFSFNNTICTIEGDPPARHLLHDLFTAIGGKLLDIQPKNKMIIHAACVMSSNYFITLIESSLTLLEQSGIPRSIGHDILKPLILNTFENTNKLDTAHALTGPISRGDIKLVREQIRALSEDNKELTKLYKLLGQFTLALAKQNKDFPTDCVGEFNEVLDT